MMNPEVVTIGLGYIGLPTSALIASKTRVLFSWDDDGPFWDDYGFFNLPL